MNNLHVEDKITLKPVIMQDLPNNGNKQVKDGNCEIETFLETELPEKENNIEDILRELKISGKYHQRFLFLLCFLLLLTTGFPINYIFTAENVSYRCKYSGCRDIEISKLQRNSTLDHKCHKYELLDDSGTCSEDNFNVSSVTDCLEWVYDKPDSFVAEFDLGCQNWKRTLVGTSHSIGYMIGLLLCGPMSDKFGRKKVIIFNTLFAGVVGILKSLVPSYWMFIALELLEPMLGDNYSAMYTMVMEMVTTQNRPIVILVFSASISLADIIMAFMAYYSPNWRIFLLILYTPAFLGILHIFWLDESLRWLLIKGRKSEAEQIIRKASKINKITLDESKIVTLRSEEKSSITLRASLRVTFASRKLIIRLILCICIWFTALFNAYALTINSVSLEGNKYINFGIVSLSGSVAGLILLYVLKKFQRKRPLILALILTGLFCVSQSFIPKGYRWLSTILYVCGKLNATIAIRMAYLYTVELFPTYTRNTMLALCSSLGRTGAILAPLTPLLLIHWSGLPSFLVGILSLLTALLVTLMPDTAKDALPDNVKQAETIGCK